MVPTPEVLRRQPAPGTINVTPQNAMETAQQYQQQANGLNC